MCVVVLPSPTKVTVRSGALIFKKNWLMNIFAFTRKECHHTHSTVVPWPAGAQGLSEKAIVARKHASTSHQIAGLLFGIPATGRVDRTRPGSLLYSSISLATSNISDLEPLH